MIHVRGKGSIGVQLEECGFSRQWENKNAAGEMSADYRRQAKVSAR